MLIESPNLSPRDVRHARITLKKLINEALQKENAFVIYFATLKDIPSSEVMNFFINLDKIFDSLFLMIRQLTTVKNIVYQYNNNKFGSKQNQRLVLADMDLIDQTDRIITSICLWNDEINKKFIEKLNIKINN